MVQEPTVWYKTPLYGTRPTCMVQDQTVWYKPHCMVQDPPVWYSYGIELKPQGGYMKAKWQNWPLKWSQSWLNGVTLNSDVHVHAQHPCPCSCRCRCLWPCPGIHVHVHINIPINICVSVPMSMAVSVFMFMINFILTLKIMFYIQLNFYVLFLLDVYFHTYVNIPAFSIIYSHRSLQPPNIRTVGRTVTRWARLCQLV